MKFTIDRFEGSFAVVELGNGDMIDIPKAIVPCEAKEGDILKIVIDKEEAEDRKTRIEDKFRRLLSE